MTVFSYDDPDNIGEGYVVRTQYHGPHQSRPGITQPV